MTYIDRHIDAYVQGINAELLSCIIVVVTEIFGKHMTQSCSMLRSGFMCVENS